MTILLIAGVVVVGAFGVVATGFVVIQVVRIRNGTVPETEPNPGRRLTAALGVALIAAVVTGEALLLARGGDSFSASGQQRYISAPFVYGAFGLIAVATTRHYAPRWPLWVIGLLATTFVSTLLSPIAGPRFTTATLLQGLVLFGGTALFAICGLLDVEWADSQRRRFLRLVLGVGAVSGLLGFTTGVFSALILPTAVTLVYLALRRARFWPVLLAVGVAIISVNLLANADAIDPSAASNGQLVVAAGVFALSLPPRWIRLALVPLSIGVGAFLLVGSDVPGLFFGQGVDVQDVTLAQRAYETQQVVYQASSNPVALLFGGGPGATVDLTASPDAATLASSGRILDAVPSVHLLTSYMILKLGLMGLAWLCTFLAASLVAAVRVLSQKRPDAFDLVLLVMVLCGAIQAVPAGAFLFSNPIPALFLAILHVRNMRDQTGRLTSGDHVGTELGARPRRTPLMTARPPWTYNALRVTLPPTQRKAVPKHLSLDHDLDVP